VYLKKWGEENSRSEKKEEVQRPGERIRGGRGKKGLVGLKQFKNRKEGK